MDAEQFKALTALAALEIDQADLKEVQQGLLRTVDMVQQLQQQDVQGVEPLRHPLDLGQRTRADTPNTDDTDDTERADPVRKQVLERAPDSLGGLFLVPKVLD